MNAIGMRKAATLLASLHPQDRAWLIERLRPTLRYDLKRLVLQAAEVGAGNPELARQVLAASAERVPPPQLPPDRLLAGLQGLTPAWTARVLAACTPDHLDAYAASTPALLVKEVRSELLGVPKVLPSKLASVLIDIARARGERIAVSALSEVA